VINIYKKHVKAILKSGKTYIIPLFTAILLLLVMSADSLALTANRIKNVTFEKKNVKETVTVFLEELSETDSFVLHNPERVVVDIKNTFLPQVHISKITKSKAVKKIRISQNKKNMTRIVLEINKNIKYNFDIIKTEVSRKPVVKIIIHLIQPSVETPKKTEIEPLLNLPGQTASQETKPKLSSPEKTEAGKTDEVVTLFDDSVPDDLFEETVKDQKESDFTISGILQLRTTLQAKNDNAVENNTSFRNKIFVETKYKNNVTFSLLSDYLYFGSDDRTDDYDLDIHEAKWQHSEKRFGFSVGKQIIRWGKTDQISPVDTLNPQDLREFILPDYEERKIPVWMADLNLFFDNFTMEGVFIPFFEESEIDYFQTNWSIFSHIKKEIQNSSLSPALKNYFGNLHVHENDPDTESEFGLRLTTTIKNVDLGVSFHRTTEDTPYFANFPVKNISVNGDFSADNLTSVLGSAVFTNENIEVEYKRTNIAGFEFETTLAGFGVRGEAAWQENESFLTTSFTSVRKPSFIYIIGADYTTPGDIYLNLQFAQRHISDYNSEILYFDQDTYTLLGEMNTDIISDWLNAGFEYSFNLNNNASYFSPRLKYTYITNLECTIGASIFSGGSDTWFGRFKDNDLLFFNISYQFQ